MAKNHDDGVKFEQEVAELFASSGYHIQTNAQKKGFEYDLIATISGVSGLTTKIAVECKFRSRQQIGSAEVNAFIAAFKASYLENEFTHAIVVSNQRFSRGAHEAIANSSKIVLRTIDELKADMNGSTNYLSHFPEGYRSRGHASFIDLYCDRKSKKTKVNGGKSFRRVPVVDECVELIEGGKKCVFLLGDFGSGKTTISERIHSEFLNKKEGKVFPVIMYLRNLREFDNDEDFIFSHFRKAGVSSPRSMFEYLSRERKVLFILDGFDEVHSNADELERSHQFVRVMRIATLSDHVLITSRPSYFSSVQELNSLMEALVQHSKSAIINPSKKQVRSDKDAQDVLNEMNNIVSNIIKGE